MKSWNELRELRASAAKEIALRNPGASAAAGSERLHVLVCAGTGCTSSSSALIMEQMQQQLTARGLDQEVRVIKTGCFGLCQKGPIVAVYPDKIFLLPCQTGRCRRDHRTALHRRSAGKTAGDERH